MGDIISVKKRSELMGSIRSRGNRETELVLLELFRTHKITGWRRHFRINGTPDFAFPCHRLAIFVDGCFWHNCPHHGHIPKTNRAFWSRKLAINKARDQMVTRSLRKAGWSVIRIWEHDLKLKKPVLKKIVRRLPSTITPNDLSPT